MASPTHSTSYPTIHLNPQSSNAARIAKMTITSQDLPKILADHLLWLQGSPKGSRANLSGADLSGADLRGANLSGANGATLAIQRTRILPEGSLIGWKKCLGGVLVKLSIPKEAKRSHAFGRKCRAEFADVLEVIGADVGVSSHDGQTEYVVGTRVVPDSFSDNWQEECAPGIHFFITREEAEAYGL